MPKSHVLQIRLDEDTYAAWRAEAARQGLSLSAFVRDAVDARCRLEARLREEAERQSRAIQMQQEAARRRAAAELSRREPTADDVLAVLDGLRPHLLPR